MRFYGLSDREVLQMPWRRATALLQAIRVLQAEEDLRAVNIAAHGANPGIKSRGLKAFIHGLQQILRRNPATSPEDDLSEIQRLPMVSAEQVPGSIAAERERQRLAAERLAAEHQAGFGTR